MDGIATILAADDGLGELLQFLPFLVIMALVYMGNLIRRKMETAEAEKQRQKAQEEGQSSSPARPVQRQALPGSLREVIERATAPTQAAPRRSALDEPEPSIQRRRRRPVEPEPEPIDEIATPTPMPAPAETPTVLTATRAPQTTVDLSSREKLRQAIIAHEIFGPPKGMRADGESWDQA